MAKSLNPMQQRLFGREKETLLLDQVCASGKAEFVAIYGRRRVGKTFLVREYFRSTSTLYFEFTGRKDASLTTQLHGFRETLETVFYSGRPIPKLDSWDSAFKTLAMALRASAQQDERAVLFLDELPWMATAKSGLIQALDHIWNTELVKMPQVILIVCGSAASWMLDNLIHAKGGLHNRITRRIKLMPFTLPETLAYLKHHHTVTGLRAAIELYMAIGGIPHYLQQLHRDLSVSQNIADLCFSENGLLRTEFTNLFAALFGESDLYERIVGILATKRSGVNRTELLTGLKADSGGSLNRKLRELEEAGFIARMTPYGHKKKNTLYRLIDPYIYFYLSWIQDAPGGVFTGNGVKYWLDKVRTPAYQSWAAYTFENLCLTHSTLIQKALRLDHVGCEVGSWRLVAPRGTRSGRNSTGAQIDLLFDRSDGIISLCEVKYCSEPFSIDKAYARELKQKLEVFQAATRTRKDLQLVLITLAGFKPNTWSEDLVNIALDAKTIFTRRHD